MDTLNIAMRELQMEVDLICADIDVYLARVELHAINVTIHSCNTELFIDHVQGKRLDIPLQDISSNVQL